MFLGHLALGLAAKRAAPKTSLAVLLSAAQLADMIWPVLLAVGVEEVRIAPGNTAFTPLEFTSYPYSHSLVTLVLLGLAFGGAYAAITKNRAAFGLLAALVVSHWVLDWITHAPDMPLYPGGSKHGLVLWNSIPGTLAVELPMFAAGIWMYVRATAPADRIGSWGFWFLMLIALVGYVASSFGPPPPTVRALWMSALIGTVVFTAWSWWADRHRT